MMNFQFISEKFSDYSLFRAFVLVICCLILMFLSSASFAEIYKWRNDDGSIGFTDDMSNVPEKYRGQVETRKYRSINSHVETANGPAQSNRVIPQTESTDDYQKPDRELSPGEKEELDKELRGIWNNMKDALGGKKGKKKK